MADVKVGGEYIEYYAKDYIGETDDQGLPHGKGSVKFRRTADNSYERFEGEFEHGMLQGAGKLTLHRRSD